MKQFNSLFQKARDLVYGSSAQSSPPALGTGQLCNVREGCPADVLVLDVSGSMECPDYLPSRLAGAKQAAIRFLETRVATHPNAVAGVVAFDDDARIVAHMLSIRDHLSALRGAVNGLTCDGSTNTGAGLELARAELRAIPRGTPRRLILLTDGYATEGYDPEWVASTVKQEQIQLDIIGVGGSPDEVNEPVLKRMASIVNHQRRYWFIRSVGELIEKFEALALREVKR